MTKTSNNDKWMYSAWAVVPFLLVSLPTTYMLTNKLLSPLGLPTTSGKATMTSACPSPLGLLLHALVFLLLVRLMMDMKKKDKEPEHDGVEKYKRRRRRR